jgi:methyl-accepting chemotaxis protein
MFSSLRTKVSVVISLTLFFAVGAHLYVTLTINNLIYHESIESVVTTFVDLSVKNISYFESMLKESEIDCEHLFDFIESVKFTPDSHTALLDTDDAVLFSSFEKGATSLPLDISIMSPDHDVVKKIEQSIGGVDYVAYYTLVDNGQLYIAFVPKKDIYLPVSDLNKIQILSGCFFGVLVIFILYSTLVRVTNRITNLKVALEKITTGDMSVRAEVDADDEIGILATNFNHMTTTLEYQRRKLEEHNRRLEFEVTARTKEVDRKNQQLSRNLDELERLNKMMVGRELKMISLKDEIKGLQELQKKSGNQ